MAFAPPEVEALVRAHGRAAISFQALGPGIQYWRSAHGCVAYVDVDDAWVTVGGAFAPAEHEAATLREFGQEAARRGKRLRLFAVEHDVEVDASIERLHLGEQPVWNPQDWPNNLGKRMRGQLRRDTNNKIVTVRLATSSEMSDRESPTRRGLDRVIAEWLDSRKIAPMGFLVRLDPYYLAEERRFFIAENKGKIVGAIVAMPVYAKNGWYLETMLRDPSAPNGAIEVMFDFAMRTFASEGSTYVTFGLCPLTGASSPMMDKIRKHTNHLYNYEGLRTFKGKLAPASWHPMYIAYPKGEGAFKATMDCLRAFLPGGFPGFLWSSLVQRAPEVTRLIAYLMLPWTLLVALANTKHWFPSPAVHAAWVALDLTIVALLFALSRGWRKSLATALAAITMFDFVASVIQFTTFNGARAHGIDWLIGALGIAAPLLASRFLWASRTRAEMFYEPGAAPAPTTALALPSERQSPFDHASEAMPTKPATP